ncbi:DUF2796 domain-containing protein [Variovorax sp. YR752]|uniref:DUF2796 domain-containing protein n=1 Tax=Variovorax sp. YR752 TaxID=1884383 RepID=UPI0031380693
MKRVLLALAIVSALPAWAGKPHVHGAATLDVAVEATGLTLSLDTPLDGLLGFERAPRTDAQRRAAEQAIATLRAAGTLFVIDPAAQCRVASVELLSAALKLGPAAAPAKDDGHGDLEAEYTFTCQSAPAFIEVGLFKAFPRMGRLDVQTATAKGQRKLVLKRPAQRIDLSR